MPPLPQVGDAVDLHHTSGDTVRVTITGLLGAARLYKALDEQGRDGVIAIQPNGTWWVQRGSHLFEEDEAEEWKGSNDE